MGGRALRLLLASRMLPLGLVFSVLTLGSRCLVSDLRVLDAGGVLVWFECGLALRAVCGVRACLVGCITLSVKLSHSEPEPGRKRGFWSVKRSVMRGGRGGSALGRLLTWCTSFCVLAVEIVCFVLMASHREAGLRCCVLHGPLAYPYAVFRFMSLVGHDGAAKPCDRYFVVCVFVKCHCVCVCVLFLLFSSFSFIHRLF